MLNTKPTQYIYKVKDNNCKYNNLMSLDKVKVDKSAIFSVKVDNNIVGKVKDYKVRTVNVKITKVKAEKVRVKAS